MTGVRSYVAFRVPGLPAPQGSKRHVGRGILVESSKRVKPWREDVRQAALDCGVPTITSPCEVILHFGFQRPKSHYGTGRNATIVKPSAPREVISRAAGDIDKLTRSTLDALVSAGLQADDSLVWSLASTKQYTATPGAYIRIEWESPA